MTALLIMFICIIILFNLGPTINNFLDSKNHVKKYKVELLDDNDDSDQAVEINGKKYKITEL